jgi:hypothetical protein
MAIKKTGSFKGKSNKLGGGGRFAQVVAAMPKNMPTSEKKAIAAMQGRKKYGNKKMSQMAAKGRSRVSKKK